MFHRSRQWMYPIAIGSGKRLFTTGTVATTFRPVEPAFVSGSGVMALVFEPAGDVETGEVGATQA